MSPVRGSPAFCSYVVPEPKILTVRVRGWLKNLLSPGYPEYVFERVGARVARQAANVGHALLRLPQASRVCRPTAPGMSIVDLEHACGHRGWPLLVSTDPHGVESLEFVASQRLDLGIVLGTGILKPALPVPGAIVGAHRGARQGQGRRASAPRHDVHGQKAWSRGIVEDPSGPQTS
jgi:hypothetical protein